MSDDTQYQRAPELPEGHYYRLSYTGFGLMSMDVRQWRALPGRKRTLWLGSRLKGRHYFVPSPDNALLTVAILAERDFRERQVAQMEMQDALDLTGIWEASDINGVIEHEPQSETASGELRDS